MNARVVVENNVASFFSGHGVDLLLHCDRHQAMDQR